MTEEKINNEREETSIVTKLRECESKMKIVHLFNLVLFFLEIEIKNK